MKIIDDITLDSWELAQIQMCIRGRLRLLEKQLRCLEEGYENYDEDGEPLLFGAEEKWALEVDISSFKELVRKVDLMVSSEFQNGLLEIKAKS
jgi:hypothetical protein